MGTANGRNLLVDVLGYITHQEHCQLRATGLVSKGCTCGAEHLTRRINCFLKQRGG